MTPEQEIHGAFHRAVAVALLWAEAPDLALSRDRIAAAMALDLYGRVDVEALLTADDAIRLMVPSHLNVGGWHVELLPTAIFANRLH